MADTIFGKDSEAQALYKPKHAGFAEDLLMGQVLGTLFKNSPGLSKQMGSEGAQNFMDTAMGGGGGNGSAPKTQINTPSGGGYGGAANPMGGLIGANYPNGLPAPKNGFTPKGSKRMISYNPVQGYY